jgi:FG-GAP repeat/FG-GAP-like repeat
MTKKIFNQFKTKNFLKGILGVLFVVLVSVFGYYFWNYFTVPPTLNTITDSLGEQGTEIKDSFSTTPVMPLSEEEKAFVFQDTKGGIEIQYAGQENKPENGIKVSLPKDYSEPIAIKLDEERVVTIKDNTQENFESEALSQISNQNFIQRLFPQNEENTNQYLKYENQRKSLIYAYQKDTATGERKLKHWTLYNKGTGEEKESYTIENATIKKNDNGDINVYFESEQDLKNQAAAKEVDPSLLERAQRTLEKELGTNPNATPDFIIPKPYFVDTKNQRQDLDWNIDEEKKTLSIEFKVSKDQYPIALDPTLQFTAPGVANGGVVISGQAVNDRFGEKMVTGDLNADGKTDLVVTAPVTDTNGAVYIFYGDSSISIIAATADVKIVSATWDRMGQNGVVVGDFNADGKVDIAVSAISYASTHEGKVYIFYNDGSFPTSAASADVTITGEVTGNNFGSSLVAGDFNADSKTDLAVGAFGYSSYTGRAYIFYNDGSIPTTAATADVIITGNATNDSFGWVVTAGDMNTDGRTDLIIGAYGYSTNTGRTYIFYNDGSIPTTAATADVTITGGATSNLFGDTLTTGDLNADGKTDLIVGAYNYTTATGRTYIFYGDGSIPTTAGTADVTITGETTNNSFGRSLATGDFNSDSKTDLIVGAKGYSSSTGRAYIFYNDGSISTTAATADVIITGETGSDFGTSLAIGDLNADGKTDLIVGAASYLTSTGRAYIFYSQNGVLNTNQNIAGNATSDQFGYSLASGDLNADGRTDLIVGATGYTSSTGRAYIFYNDGSIPTTATTADVTITGEASFDNFGSSMIMGDLNSDSKTDLVVGAFGYTSSTGRAYIFYNDGSIPTTAATADVIITGNATGDSFGNTLTSGDLNSDGKVDLVVGAGGYSTSTGRAYIFYNDGSIPTTAATADVNITGGGTSNFFGDALATGDLNSDGRADIIVGAFNSSTSTGRAYIFYNDGSIPTTAATADVNIVGEATNNYFGVSLITGDLNSDGKTDLVVGAPGYSTDTGRAYIFYNDGSIPTTAATADVTITGNATNDYFGPSLITGDLNSDGKTDLVVGATGYSTDAGRTYIFYNDGSIPTTAATADVTITGNAANNLFGDSLTLGDLNADGKTDLIVGERGYSTNTGRVYIYNGQDNFSWSLQSQPIGGNRVQPNVTGEELQITGETGSGMGNRFATGDLNSDGKADLIVGARSYSSSTGRVYVFYSDGGYPSGASSADIVITGNATSDAFGAALATGDLNSDGRIDLAVGASGYSANTGRAYIFYNDGSIPTSAATADVTITGEATERYFGVTLSTGDFDSSGTTDIAIGAPAGGITAGRALIFYNDGSIPTTEGTADVTINGGTLSAFGSKIVSGDMNADGTADIIVSAPLYTVGDATGRVFIYYNDGSYGASDVTITGDAPGDNFSSLATGDFNSDGKVDLAVGASGYSTSTGRVYIFYNDGSIPTTAATADVTITGNTSGDSFGSSVASGDLNTDGRADIIIGAYSYSSSTGRSYIFYNDGSIPTTAATADVTLTGEATSNSYGLSLITGDFNADGRTDLAIGATGYSSSKGRIYLYTFNDGETTGSATGDYFGESMTSGDFNADGKIDLAVGAYGYSSSTGRVYLFYGKNGNMSTTASGADVTITGNAAGDTFGETLIAGDLNADGETDLVVGAPAYSTNTGRVYLFYNDGSIPTTAATADVTITGESTNDYFGYALATGDMNTDGELDLVVSGYRYDASYGSVYMFHNDGSYTSAAGSADTIIRGVEINGTFGSSLASGDIDSDGDGDLLVGANANTSGGITSEVYIFYNDGSYPANLSSADIAITSEDVTQRFGSQVVTGDFNADGRVDFASSAIFAGSERVYLFYNDGSIPTTAATADVIIDNEATSDAFGEVLGAADMNADGKVDLIVSAQEITTNTGHAYIFYNDGTYPTLAASADKIYRGATTSNYFGSSLAALDFNFDGIQDLAIGAYGYSTNTGRVYTLASETESVSEAESTATTSLKGGTIQMKGSGIKMR